MSTLSNISTITLDGGGDFASVAQRSVLDAIERELAQLHPDYSQNVLRLAEAYAWLAGSASYQGS